MIIAFFQINGYAYGIDDRGAVWVYKGRKWEEAGKVSIYPPVQPPQFMPPPPNLRGEHG